MPPSSRMNPVSTPPVVVDASPSAVWWNHVEPSLVRSELSVPAWARPEFVPPCVMPDSCLWSVQVSLVRAPAESASSA